MSAWDYALPAAGAFALALAFRGALRLPAGARRAVAAGVAGILLAVPLLVPAGACWGRLLVSLGCIVWAAKVADLSAGAAQGRVPGWGATALFLVSGFCMVERRLADEPRPPARADLARLGRGAFWLAAGLGAFAAAGAARVERLGFAGEHVVASVSVFLAVYGGCDAASAAWRLAGLPGKTVHGNYFAAATPAEFWRRYNRPVTQWLFENVYRRAGGAASPARAGITAFAVSAAAHEYLVSMTLGRLQGLMTAFFMIQGIAAVATARRRPRRAAAALAVAATFAFNVATVALFLAAASCVFNVYRSPLPRLLQW